MVEPNTFTFNLMLTFTIILLLIKLLWSILLGREIINKKKRLGVFEFDILFAVFILMICLFTSRLLYVYFDFFLTRFDNEEFYKPQNFIVYKVASFIAAFGFAFVLFTIDKIALNFKFKGIPSYFFIGGFIILLIYPVNSEEDFRIISIIEIISLSTSILVPALLIYFGIKAPEIRKLAFLIALGIIIYFIGTIIINGYIYMELLGAPFGTEAHLLVHLLYTALKIVGLSLVTFGSSNLYFYSYFKYKYLYEIKET